MKITNFEEKEMISLTTKQNESYQNQEVCQICKKNLVTVTGNTIKSEIIVILLVNIEELLMFMSSSLSSLVDNLSEGLHNNKCIDCKSCLEYISTKDNQFMLRSFECKKKI